MLHSVSVNVLGVGDFLREGRESGGFLFVRGGI
jgi:hypothetical protein